MSLLLCKREAGNPFYSEKLDIRLWSMQELCYVIYNHPLLAAEDLRDSEALCSWLREDAGQGFLAAKIEQIRAAAKAEERDPTDELLLAILRDCNYYAPGETEACRRKLLFYQECPPEDRAHAEGVSLFRLRRYRMAEERFWAEEKLLRERADRMQAGQERDTLLRRLAETICDRAVIRLQLFEKKEAEALLLAAEQTADCKRAEKFLYFLHSGDAAGQPVSAECPASAEHLVSAERPASAEHPVSAKQTGSFFEKLTDEEKSELDKKREEARLHALSGRRMQEISTLFEMDPVKRETACAGLLRKWKKEYRRMR